MFLFWFGVKFNEVGVELSSGERRGVGMVVCWVFWGGVGVGGGIWGVLCMFGIIVEEGELCVIIWIDLINMVLNE